MPASGYFEWTGPKNDRQPHYFTRLRAVSRIALAGLWDRWWSKDKSETKETFTIITTEPSKFAGSVPQPHATHPGAGHLGSVDVLIEEAWSATFGSRRHSRASVYEASLATLLTLLLFVSSNAAAERT